MAPKTTYALVGWRHNRCGTGWAARVLFLPQEGPMQSDQEFFTKGLAAYQKVVSMNYMAHREAYDLLHRLLVNEAPDQFAFLDVACGTATGSAKALKGTKIGRYIGIDISQQSLDVAQEALKDLNCPVELRC